MSDNSLKKGRYTTHSNKIGLYSADQERAGFVQSQNDVVLNFPFKDCVLEAGMNKEDVGRDERFLHIEMDGKDIDVLFEPKVLTNYQYYSYDKSTVTTVNKQNNPVSIFDEHGNLLQNLLIKGNNLLALHSLKTRLAGKVKLIYIDPPYNTKGEANTFAYNNNFNHSSWLVFMKNRLEIAKDFLSENGFIAISIDHYELFYLGVLADEIFNRENRVGIVSVVHKPEGRNQEKFFGTSNEFLLVYAKNKEKADFESVVLDEEISQEYNLTDEKGKYKLKNFIRLTDGKYALRSAKPNFYYPIYVSKTLDKFSIEPIDGYNVVYPITINHIERTWKTLPKTFLELVEKGDICAQNEDGNIVIYEKLRENQVIKTHWIKKEYHAYHYGTKPLEQLLGEKLFSFPKSTYLIKDILKLMSSENDIILDFFGGSGTTAHAVLDLNKNGGHRKFVLVEQMDYINTVTLPRINTVIQNEKLSESFVYMELKKYNLYFIEKIQSAKNMGELDQVYDEMMRNAFLKFWFDKEDFQKSYKKDADDNQIKLDERKQILISILDENQLYLNYVDMNDARYQVSDDEKALSNAFYGEYHD